jgi:hypothetical protein
MSARGATNHAELSAGLREALIRDNSGFFDALYDVEAIEDPDGRGIVEQLRDQSKLMLARARGKLNAKKVEIVEETRDGSQFITRFLVDDNMRIEVVVDDVFERDGELHTRDVVQINLI